MAKKPVLDKYNTESFQSEAVTKRLKPNPTGATPFQSEAVTRRLKPKMSGVTAIGDEAEAVDNPREEADERTKYAKIRK